MSRTGRRPTATAALRTSPIVNRRRLACTAAFLIAMCGVACGKKGPPLPPIARIPAAPASFAAERRGDTVDISLVVPAANMDGSRPANVQRIDVYGYTAPTPLGAAEIVRQGTLVGSIPVKRPRDPNKVIEADESESDIQPLLDTGLDQGATVHLSEALADEVRRVAALPPPSPDVAGGAAADSSEDASRPDIAGGAAGDASGVTPNAVPSRRYVAVPINTRGQRGTPSQTAGVPLVSAPAVPVPPVVVYDEKGITVIPVANVSALTALLGGAKPAEGEPPLANYHIYRVEEQSETRLTKSPLPAFRDEKIDWGVERCYVLRATESVDGLMVESEASEPGCVTLKDTFPPVAPTGLTAVASEGSINLIWDENTEKDLLGYVVVRTTAPGIPPQVVTPAPITVTRFTDRAPAGSRFIYAVVAVDTAGNISPPSNFVEETAR